MTPQEKAKELVEKYLKMEYGILQEYLPTNHINIAKQCALIAVAEIIEETKKQATDFKDDFRLMFWQQVEKEIPNV